MRGLALMRRASAGGFRPAWLLLVTGVCSFMAAWSVADSSMPRAARFSRPPGGALSALTGRGACFGTGCARLRGPQALLRIAISPDGRDLYLSGQAGGLGVLARNRRSGRLRQLSGRAGCVRRDGRQSCATVPELRNPGAIVVSPDGRSVYVTTAHGILAFVRNRLTGAIRALTGAHGCVDAQRRSCQQLRGMTAPTTLLAAENRTFYVAGTLPDAQGGQTGALAVLSRDPATGALSQLPGTGGCMNGSGSQGCATTRCLDTETTLALSRDRSHLYTGSTDSLDFELTSPGMVSTFARANTGALTFVGCDQRQAAISDVLAEPRSDSVLVSTLYGNRGTGVGSATIDLYAPQRGGELKQKQQLACSSDSQCQVPFGPDISTVAITPDGNTAYYEVFFGGVAAFRVGPRSLVPLSGRWGCLVSTSQHMPPARCRRAGQQIGPDMVISPDGRNLYVSTLGGNGNTNHYAGGVEALSVQR